MKPTTLWGSGSVGQTFFVHDVSSRFDRFRSFHSTKWSLLTSYLQIRHQCDSMNVNWVLVLWFLFVMKWFLDLSVLVLLSSRSVCSQLCMCRWLDILLWWSDLVLLGFLFFMCHVVSTLVSSPDSIELMRFSFNLSRSSIQDVGLQILI